VVRRGERLEVEIELGAKDCSSVTKRSCGWAGAMASRERREEHGRHESGVRAIDKVVNTMTVVAN
jgi:hypothetical protein